MRLPESIVLRATTSGGAPLPRAWLELHVGHTEVPARSDFLFVVGPTGADGVARVSRDFLLEDAQQATAGPAGEASLEALWNGALAVRVAGRQVLRQRFRTHAGERAQVADALATLRALRDDPPLVTAEVEPAGAATVTLLGGDDEDWLPDDLANRILDIIGVLARGDVAALADQGVIDPDAEDGIAEVIRDYPATLVEPPEALALLMTAYEHEDGWSVDIPLWSPEEGPSDLEVSVEVTGDGHIAVYDVRVP